MDLACLAVESSPEAGVSLRCFPLGCDDSPVSVTPAQVTCLRQDVFTKGQVRTDRTRNINYISSSFPFYHHTRISGLSSKKGLVYGNCQVCASAPLLSLLGEHSLQFGFSLFLSLH